MDPCTPTGLAVIIWRLEDNGLVVLPMCDCQQIGAIFAREMLDAIPVPFLSRCAVEKLDFEDSCCAVMLILGLRVAGLCENVEGVRPIDCFQNFSRFDVISNNCVSCNWAGTAQPCFSIIISPFGTR